MSQRNQRGSLPLVWYEPFWRHRRRRVAFAEWIVAWTAGSRGVVLITVLVLASIGLVVALRREHLIVAFTAPIVTIVGWIGLSYVLTLMPRGVRIEANRLVVIGLRQHRFDLDELDVAWIESIDNGERQLLMRFPATTIVLGLPTHITEGILVSALGDKLRRTACE